MAIKNMPHFDDIEIGGEEKTNNKSLEDDLKQEIHLNINDLTDLESLLNTLGLNKNLDLKNLQDNEMNNSFDSIEDFFQMMNNNPNNISNLMSEIMNVYKYLLKNNPNLSKMINNKIDIFDDDDNDDEISHTITTNFEGDISENDDENEELEKLITELKKIDLSDDDMPEANTSEQTKENDPNDFSKNPDIQYLLQQHDEKYSIACESFSLRQLDNKFPELSEIMQEMKFDLSIFKNFINKKFTDVYDSCTLLDEVISEEAKSYTFLMFSETVQEPMYLPTVFTLYYDGQEFKYYVHRSGNTIAKDGHIYNIEEILGTELYENIKNSNPTCELVDLYKVFYSLFTQIGILKTETNEVLLPDIFIDKSRIPIATINEIGTFNSEPTKYYENGLFYIGNIELDNSEEAKYFVSDYDLSPVDNKLNVYAVFGYDVSLPKKIISSIETTFDSKFIETNDTFKRYVSISPCNSNSVLIKFNNL